MVDTTQAIGWLPVDADAADLQVCAAYKWLCSPRGTAFLVHHPLPSRAHPTRVTGSKPLAAGWFAGEVPHESYYGLPLRLARDARRFDISPAWHCWVGTAPALQVLASVGVAAIGEHNIALANRVSLRAGPATVELRDRERARRRRRRRRLTAAGVRFGMRAGRVRVAFHLYSTERDVDLAVAAVRG